MTLTVEIGCFREHLEPPSDGQLTVAVDVIRATTTAITAAAGGRAVFVAPSIESAVPLAARLTHPWLAGELGGFMPYGFHVQNSPSVIMELDEPERPLLLLSTSGTRLMAEAGEQGGAYAACLRNARAQAEHIAGRGVSVRLLGADSRGEFRDEDQLCCARIGRVLVERGYQPADEETAAVLARWGEAADDAFLNSRSVAYLRDTGQERDVDFVLDHIDDLTDLFSIKDGEIVRGEVV
jgi:2-phosphosulfolactate phosphatase